MSEVQTRNGDMGGEMGAEMLPSDRVLQMEQEEKREQEEVKRHREPPIVFKDLINVEEEFESLGKILDGKLNDNEKTNLHELHAYVFENEGSWALGDNFLNFVG